MEKGTELPKKALVNINRPAKLYEPLGSKNIRLLTIQPLRDGESSDMPISCSLDKVCLTDWTSKYQSFRDILPQMGTGFRLIKGRTRHAQWNLYNVAIRNGVPLKEMLVLIAPENIKRNVLLHGFCDKPLERFEDLDSRYNWGDFVALSYVWGDQTHKKTIFINGSPFEVGLSLHEALQSLRTSFEVKSRGLKIWIDAICINQDDLDERATEVQKMELIYTEALTVRAWLGTPSPDVAAELPRVRELLDVAFASDSQSSTIQEIKNSENTHYRWEMETSRRFTELIAEVEDNAYSLWTFIEELSQVPYWQRLWIIQEVALGSSLVFWYGDQYFTPKELRVFQAPRLWDFGGSFRKLIRYFGEDRLLASIFGALNVVARIGSLRCDDDGNSIHAGEKPVLDSITEARNSHATDLRDKVYGLLAFLPSPVLNRIKPDYRPGFTWRSCWTMFAKSCYEGEGNLNMLARVAGRALGDSLIPTWAFDLSTPGSKYRLSTFRPDDSEKWVGPIDGEDVGPIPHDAVHTFESNKGLEETFEFSDDGSLLFCRGAFVDTVGAITSFRSPGQMKATPAQNFDPHLHSEPFPISSNTASNTNSRLALARVLQYDSTFEFGERPSVLEVPWIEPDELRRIEVCPDDFIFDQDVRLNLDQFGIYDWKIHDEAELSHRGIPWTEFFKSRGNREVFSRVLHVNESFEFQGTPLKNFFTSREEYCKDVRKFSEAIIKTAVLLYWRRLFQTGNGFIGSVTRHALPGDKIAVIYNCDTPVVLRPSGSGGAYEVVGGCFVEGYMMGELVENIKSGQLKTQTLCLV